MPIRAHLADGRVLVFPDGTDPEIVKIRAEEATRGEPPRNPEQLARELAMRKAATPGGPTGRERIAADNAMVAPVGASDIAGGLGLGLGAFPEAISSVGRGLSMAFPNAAAALSGETRRLPARIVGGTAGAALGHHFAGVPGGIIGGATGFVSPELAATFAPGYKGAIARRILSAMGVAAPEEAMTAEELGRFGGLNQEPVPPTNGAPPPTEPPRGPYAPPEDPYLDLARSNGASRSGGPPPPTEPPLGPTGPSTREPAMRQSDLAATVRGATAPSEGYVANPPAKVVAKNMSGGTGGGIEQQLRDAGYDEDYIKAIVKANNPAKRAEAYTAQAAQSDPVKAAQAKAELAKLGVNTGGADTLTVYNAGGSPYYTTNLERAASYLPEGQTTLNKVENLPREVFEAGRAEAAQHGQPTPQDTYLPDEWIKRAVPHEVGEDVGVHTVQDSGQSIEDILKELSGGSEPAAPVEASTPQENISVLSDAINSHLPQPEAPGPSPLSRAHGVNSLDELIKEMGHFPGSY